MQNLAMTTELERMLDTYLDPFARVTRVEQVITEDGRIPKRYQFSLRGHV